MTWKQWLTRWKLDSLEFPENILSGDWTLTEDDRRASWELVIELFTRITTQPLPDRDGDEKAALTSVYHLFGISRDLMRKHGRDAMTFSLLTLAMLNQKVRPFTAKWHRKSEAGEFDNAETCREFRKELGVLRELLAQFGGALAVMADAADLNRLYPPPTG